MRTRTLTAVRAPAFLGLGLVALAGLFYGCSDASSEGGDDAGAADAATDRRAPVDAASPHDAATGAPDATADTSTRPVDASTPDAARDAAPADASPAHDAATSDASAPDAASADAGSSLIGRWTFDEGAGTSSLDRSGHGHDAVLSGAATWSAAGHSGGGLLLDGTTGYADVGATVVDTSKSFTVACWVKLAVTHTWAVAISEDDVVGSAFGLKLRGDNSNAFDFDFQTSDTASPGFVVAQSTSTAVTNAWTHLAGVYDRSGTGSIKVYVNGVMETKAAFAQALVTPKGHLLIGRGLYNGTTGSFVNGIVDDMEVHDVALSDAQIAAIYASTPADAGAPDAGADAGTDAAPGADAATLDAGAKDAASSD